MNKQASVKPSAGGGISINSGNESSGTDYGISTSVSSHCDTNNPLILVQCT